jgi:hypothetical protein
VIFAWDAWNREHATRHGVKREDSEYVVKNASAPYPRRKEEGKQLVWGPDRAGRIIEVIFACKAPDEIEFDSISADDLPDISEREEVVAVYIIHAMPLDGRRLRQYRRTLW